MNAFKLERIIGTSLQDFESTQGVAAPYHCGTIRMCGLESYRTSYL